HRGRLAENPVPGGDPGLHRDQDRLAPEGDVTRGFVKVTVISPELGYMASSRHIAVTLTAAWRRGSARSSPAVPLIGWHRRAVLPRGRRRSSCAGDPRGRSG